MKTKKTSEKLISVLEKEGKKISLSKSRSLGNGYKILVQNGFLTKTEYSFPLIDTIGRRFHEKAKFSNRK